ncbi:MAG: SDR family NAD(P)-dependent oxidoreductase [Acetobacteraceae bacterium]|nr:SDR family NAD(P)-dependent oxidoreductase [Acetobacteraceae bacterium]
MTGPILITGGAGFIGSNLADRLAGSGHHVIVFDSLTRAGADENLAWLCEAHQGRIEPVIADIRDRTALGEAARGVSAVFHLAAQVAVTTSMEHPREDFEVNLLGTMNLLEALRRRASNPPPAIFASTNKVYGNLDGIALFCDGQRYRPRDPALALYGVSEDCPLRFQTPYGCSKGAADQYVIDYGRSFAIPTMVLRMSCVYGRRQRGTEDQGWLAHFLKRLMAGQPLTIYGDGRQVRDLLWVDDAVDAYIAAFRRIETVQGQAFNLGGGPSNAVTLLEVVARIEAVLRRQATLRFDAWRPGDQRYFVADTRRARAALALPRPRDWRDGVAELAGWFLAEQETHAKAEAAQ